MEVETAWAVFATERAALMAMAEATARRAKSADGFFIRATGVESRLTRDASKRREKTGTDCMHPGDWSIVFPSRDSFLHRADAPYPPKNRHEEKNAVAFLGGEK
jgi:hypothetical protein